MSGWIQSETHPEYIEKNVTIGGAKIVILRPILSEAEAAKAKEKARAALENVMREHYKTRTQREDTTWEKKNTTLAL